jgi:hypothetical protein
VVFLGVSTSQVWLMAFAAFSLLLLATLLWMNLRTRPILRPLVVCNRPAVLCPVDSVALVSEAFVLRTPARAPPTFASPSNPVDLEHSNSGVISGSGLMDPRAQDSAEVFR